MKKSLRLLLTCISDDKSFGKISINIEDRNTVHVYDHIKAEVYYGERKDTLVKEGWRKRIISTYPDHKITRYHVVSFSGLDFELRVPNANTSYALIEKIHNAIISDKDVVEIDVSNIG